MTAPSRIQRSLDWFRSRVPRQTTSNAALGNADAPMCLLVVANALIPTVQLSLVYPLEARLNDGQCRIDFLTEHEIKLKFGKKLRTAESATWVKQRILAMNPTHIIFCRYSGPHYQSMLATAQSLHIPTIYCIDDDLLNVPLALGKQKFDYHNHPLRLEAVRYLLDNVDLVYCANECLKSHLLGLGIRGNLHAGQIFCAGKVICPAEERPTTLIGYMGFDHAHDFEIALPAVVNALLRHSQLRFELFGKIPKPRILDQFGDRVTMIGVASDYETFLQQFAARRWDIGICPLAPTDFNRVKNINKWIEYTAVGAAVIASRGMIYDECCATGCGYLADDDQWDIALTELIRDPRKRFDQVVAAQEKLSHTFTVAKLSDQLIATLEMARSKNNNCN